MNILCRMVFCVSFCGWEMWVMSVTHLSTEIIRQTTEWR